MCLSPGHELKGVFDLLSALVMEENISNNMWQIIVLSWPFSSINTCISLLSCSVNYAILQYMLHIIVGWF